MTIVDKNLRTNLASIGFKQASGMEMGVNAMSMFAGTQSTDLDEGRVLQLLNMVTAEELIDNDEYEGKQDSGCVLEDANFCNRNLRRRTRRMPEVWPDIGYEDTEAGRWKSTVCRSRQDLHQVCGRRGSEEGTASVGRKKIRRPHCCNNIL